MAAAADRVQDSFMARHAFTTAGLLMASRLAGCGGGGGSHIIPLPPDIATLTAIASIRHDGWRGSHHIEPVWLKLRFE
jgi:hypothetical protein